MSRTSCDGLFRGLHMTEDCNQVPVVRCGVNFQVISVIR